MVARENYVGLIEDLLYLPLCGIDGKMFYLQPTTFEIIMDRLEKGWFDLVSAYDNVLVERNGDLFFRLKTSPNPIWHFHLKT